MDFETDFRDTILFAVVYVLVDRGITYVLSIVPPPVPTSVSFALTSYFGLGTFMVSFVAAFLLFTLVTLRRTPKALKAYLFFPGGAPKKDLASHETAYQHRLLVNFKTKPPVAIELTPGSYGWNLVKKRNLWVPELDTAPNDPKFLENWCREKHYLLAPLLPTRDVLLANGVIYLPHRPDPRYDDIRYQAWYPFYCHILKWLKKGVPHRRIWLNLTTRKACPMEEERFLWASCGRIKGHVGIAKPRFRHAQRWAEEQNPPFTWIQLPKKDEVFSESGKPR